jgi:hypothetical protein
MIFVETHRRRSQDSVVVSESERLVLVPLMEPVA